MPRLQDVDLVALWKLGVDALVQREAHRVVLLNALVEDALHKALLAEALLDVPRHPELGVQLGGLEPADVRRVEKHVLHRRRALVHLDGIARKQDALDNEPVRVHGVHLARAHELRRDVAVVVLLVAEDENGARAVAHRAERARTGKASRQEALVALLLAGAAGHLREKRLGSPLPEAADKAQGVFGGDGHGRVHDAAVGILDGALDCKVHHAQAILVRQQAANAERHARAP
mmetsp:Transcript_24907/g.77954  ORF Transcript_24907/g.77954 Transcript_24907/m.77954 type:complete len:232 (+) Transcript_24907:1532-2227(+)